ncbi:hypothetical protein ACFL96_00585 [Thermoproteota archaeon]
MIKKVTLSLILIVACLNATAMAEGDYFLPTDVGSSAHMIRLGNIEGFSMFSEAVFENPAALHRIKNSSASLFSTKFMNEVDYRNLSVATRMMNGVIGIGIMMAGVSDIPKTELEDIIIEGDLGGGLLYDIVDGVWPVQVGSFSYLNTVTKFSYQYTHSKDFHIGASLVYYSTDVEKFSARGVNFDAGALWESENFTTSFQVKNIFPGLKVQYSHADIPSYNAAEIPPLQILYSIKWVLNEFDIYAQLKTFKSERIVKGVGLNYRAPFFKNLEISGGYKEVVVRQKIKQNFTLGIGLILMGMNVDYAYENSEHIEFSHKHYFSVGLNF